jgi:hypothetical protein
MTSLGGVLVIIGVACVGGGFLMDTNYGAGTTRNSSIPLWRGFRRVGFGSAALGLVALGLGLLFG